MYNFLANTKRMTISSMVIALYVVLLYVTQGVSFGPYQIRIATALYALAFVYPFLVVPMGIANFAANFLFGGLGLLDMAGGCLVGWLTTWLIVQVRLRGWNVWLAAGLRPCLSGGFRRWASACGCPICLAFPTACSSRRCRQGSFCRLSAAYFSSTP